jgi:hypothetical protein
MSDEQYTAAEAALLGRLQAMQANESGAASLIPSTAGSDDSGDTLDDKYNQPISSDHHQAAYNEWMQYCGIIKFSWYFPKKFKKNGLLEIGKIRLGIVEEPGEDLQASHPFKRCTLADFIDGNRYFDIVKFMGLNKQMFPFLYKLVCCLAAMRMNEVGCEHSSALPAMSLLIPEEQDSKPAIQGNGNVEAQHAADLY